MLSINNIIHNSEIYGAGNRTVIWTQGCSIHCKGCWNKELWSFKSNNKMDIVDIAVEIRDNKSDGVTILGGEPFDQFIDLAKLCERVKLITPDVDIIVYTGYDKADGAFSARLDWLKKRGVDVVISGRYDESLRDISSGILGSTNQKINLLSDRYCKEDLIRGEEVVEIEIDELGAVGYYGYPDEILTGCAIVCT